MTTGEEKKLYIQGVGGADGKGIACHFCGCRDLRAASTQRRADVVVRYRYCRNCGKGIRTVERAG